MKRKILLLICLVLFIVSIAGVSAADDANQIIDDDDVNDLVGSADTLSVSQSDVEILGSADKGTFTSLQKKIDEANESTIINLDKDYEFDSNIDWNGIGISKSITINGNGHTIDGNGVGENGVFYISSDAMHVVLKNISFINGHSFYDDGGFIYSESCNLTIDACNFTDCAVYEDGGAVYSADPTGFLTVTSCNFIGNRAERGGAIFCDGPLTVSFSNFEENGGRAIHSHSDLTVISCNFNDNNDGAIQSYGPLTVSSSNFTCNHAYQGGAISCGDLTLSSSNFIDNHASDDGGAIYADLINVIDSNFVNNTGDRWWSQGGAIYSTTSYGSIINSIFANNSPNDYFPEEIYTENVVKSSHIDFDLGTGTFTIDEDVQIGITLDDGATGEVIVSIDGVEETLTLEDNCAYITKSDLAIGTYDVLVRYGGDDSFSLSEKSTSFKVVEASFDELQDLIYDLEDGDVLELTKDYTYIDSSISIYEKNIRINGNGHSLNGNGRRIMEICDSNVILENIKFENAFEEYDSAAINFDGGNLTVINCDFTNNKLGYEDYDDEGSDGDGVAIYFKNGNLTVTGSNFINNTGGSTIYTYNGIVDITVSNFINNSEDNYAVRVIGGKITYDNLTFINNPNISFEKFSVNIYVHVNEDPVIYPNKAFITIYADKDGYFDVYVNDEHYARIKLIEYEDYCLKLSNLQVGDYEVKVTFKGDENYYDAEDSDTFEVKRSSQIKLDIAKDIVITGDYQIITVSLPKSATGDVQLWLNDDYYDSSEINNGQAVFNLTDLTADSYEVRVYYGGDEIYVSNSSEGEFHVLDPDSISVYAEDTTNLGTLHIDIYVGTLLSVNVAVKVGSNTYHAVAVNGYACIEINNLKTGKYKITATYKNSKATTTVKVKDATFTDLQNAIDALDEGGTLYLNGDVKRTGTFDEDEWEDYSESEIHINKAITIDGRGYAIDGDEEGRIFNIASDNVLLKNITFTNALPVNPDDNEYEYKGGAVAIYANNVVISDCYFNGNGINGPGKGAAIYCEGDLTVINSSFEVNAIKGYSWDDCNGGAISIVGDLTVVNSTFISNGAGSNGGSLEGGAIYSTGTVDISDSIFAGNYLSGQHISGGAVSASTVNVYNSVFNDNYVESLTDNYWYDIFSCGGAIYAGVINIQNSDFTNNSASGYHSDDSYYGVENIVHGGAISSYDITNIENSNFKDNVADEGEALWAYALYANIDDDTTFTNNDYVLVKVYPDMSINISSPIFNVGDNVKIIVEFNNHVIGNVSIRVNDDERIVEVIDDSATLTLSNMAKGTYKVNATFIENEYCEYDSAASKFKVIDVPFATFTELQELIDNANDGDTIYLTKYYIYDPKVDEDSLDICKNITIIGNGNTIDGNIHHILDVSADNVVLKDIMFIDGYGMSAGAIYSYGNLDVINCIFENNTITVRGIYPDYGGAIYSQGNLNVINSSFISNKAPFKGESDTLDYGGAIASYGKLTVINSLFVGNVASVGGAIHADNVVAIDSTFINNTASRKPGAIDAYNNLTLVNCTFENNIPNDYKHDLSFYIHYDASLYRENDDVTIFVNVYDNIKSVKIDVSGVVKTVDVVNETAKLTLNDCDAGVYDVIVSYDGDDYYDSKSVESSFTVIDDSYGTFTELRNLIKNAAEGDTIVLSKNYIFDSDNDPDSIRINKDITIKGNGHIIDANSQSGACFKLDADNIVFDNLVFAHYMWSIVEEYDYYEFEYPDANLTFTNCIFEDNRDAYRFITLYHTNLTLIDSAFVNNQVYTSIILAGTVNVINSNFKNNTATAVSTPVCTINGNNITVTDSTFEDNTYEIPVGKIKVFDIYCRDTLFVVSSTFINNSTDMDDYIYVTTGRKTVTNSEFIDKSQTPGKVNIQITAPNINVGENLIVDVSVSGNATGSVTLSINNNNQTKNLVGSKATFTVSGLAEGTYALVVYYSGDENYNASQKSASVKVSKIAVAMTISADDIYVGEDLVVDVSLTNGAVGDVVLSVDNKEYTATLVNSKATFTVSGLAAGKYDVLVTYAGNEKYASSNGASEVAVNKIDTSLTLPDVTTTYNTTGKVIATLKDINGNIISGVKVKITVGNLSKTAKTNKNGQVGLDISSLEPGVYEITAKSAATDIYKATTATAKATVKIDTTLTIPDVVTVYGASGNVVATLTDSFGNVVSGVNVKIVVGSLSKTAKTNKNGQVSLDISSLEPGEYKISARSSATSDIYNEARVTANATVLADKIDTTLTIPDVLTVYGAPSSVVATLTDSFGNVVSGVNVKIVVGSLSKTAKTNKNGQVSLDISSLEPGEYKISARSSATSAIYNEARATAMAVVSTDKIDTVLTVPDVIVVGDSPAVVVATLTDANGNIVSGVNVKIVVGSLSKTAKTDANGQVSLDISSLGPGEYKISARSSATSAIYNEARATAMAVVSTDKIDTVLTVPDVIAVGDSPAVVVATLKDSYGNVVSGVNVKIVVGSLSKTAKTDANGQVSLDISSLAPGEYKISARSSATSAIYKEAKATAKAIISEDKINTVLTAADVTTTHNSGKKLITTLKDSYGNAIAGIKVRITVGTLNKVLKTNSKGQAGLDVSTLDVGTYTAAIKSATTDIYKATKTTANVIINR